MRRPRAYRRSDDNLVRVRVSNAESFESSAQIDQDRVQLEILSECLEPLLKLNQRKILANTISSDLITLVKESLQAVQQKLGEPGKTGPSSKKPKGKAVEPVDRQAVLSELQEAKQVLHNMELLQQEEASNMSSLLKQTDLLNEKI